MLKLLFIFLGGGLGSMCRYSISAYIVKTTSTHFPYATFLANAIGCLLIGLLIGYFQQDFVEASPLSPPSQTKVFTYCVKVFISMPSPT